MTKIEQKQDELIKSLKELVNLCDAPQYFEIIAAKKAMKEIVEHHESDLSALKAMEGEDVSDENDFVQYVTNLLYMAHGFGEASEGVNTPVFDKWVEKEMENMSEFYASHNLLARKVSDEIIKPTADIDSIMRWLNDGNIKGDFDYVSLTPRYIAGLIQSFIAQWVLPIPKTVEFPNDTYELTTTETCNKVITEIDKCECGHIAPLGFIHWNQDGDSTCVNCVNDILIDRLDKKNKQIKRLKDKAHRDNLIKKG
jgi:hypothetical protein